MANDYISSSTFSLPDDILKKLRRTSFLTGRSPGPEFTKAAISGALEVGATQASRQAEISARRKIEEDKLAQQNQQYQQSQANDYRLQRSAQEQANTRALYSGIGSIGASLLFAPINFKSGSTSFTTGAGAIVSGIKKLFF